MEGSGWLGKLKKAKAEQMELLPSMLCVHKAVDGADSRFALLQTPPVPNPLENGLGVHHFGTYWQVAQAEPPD